MGLRALVIEPENLIPNFKCRNIFAFLYNLSSKFGSGYLFYWFEETGNYPHEKWFCSDSRAIRSIYCSRVYFYQNFTLIGDRLFDLGDLKKLRWSIPGVYGRPHNFFTKSRVVLKMDRMVNSIDSARLDTQSHDYKISVLIILSLQCRGAGVGRRLFLNSAISVSAIENTAAFPG